MGLRQGLGPAIKTGQKLPRLAPASLFRENGLVAQPPLSIIKS
jgi:hypothetical protein